MVDILSFLAGAHIDSFQAHYILAVSDMKVRVFQGRQKTQPLVVLLTVGLGANLGFRNPYLVSTCKYPGH